MITDKEIIEIANPYVKYEVVTEKYNVITRNNLIAIVRECLEKNKNNITDTMIREILNET